MGKWGYLWPNIITAARHKKKEQTTLFSLYFSNTMLPKGKTGI